MSQTRKRTVISVLAFLIPGLVMLGIYASLGFAPWGEKTVLQCDMSGQYVDFFCGLKQGDLFFSWSKMLGSGYIGVFSYYLSSPFSLLTLLAPNESMAVCLMYLTVLKIALSGLTFAVFAQRRFPGCGVSALVCAVCYALMSYNAAYSMCVMWLDGVIWLPLILLALERVLAGRSAGPFLGALTVCFISTWYISYMVGIFCALYLCVRLAALRPDRKRLGKILARFFGSAACALGLTAWLWLPTLLAMYQGKFSAMGSIPYNGLMLCHPILLVGQLLPGRFGVLDYDALPYVFCGSGIMVLVLVHFSYWEPYGREKLAERGLLLVLALSMILSPLDKAWHLFQRPNWFPYRYAFVFSFFLLYLTVQALPNLLAALGRKWGRQAGRGAALALVVLAAADMGLNMRGFVNRLQELYPSNSDQAYRDYYAANEELAAAAEADAAGGFYRVGAMEDRGLNAPIAFGYPGLTHYSSFYNYNVNCLLKDLGLSQFWYWCAYRGSTPPTDALLDMGYVISRTNPSGYQPVAEVDGLTLWKNPDVLPLAFLAEGRDVQLTGNTPFERLNSLYSGLLGEEIALFTPVSADVDAGAEATVYTLAGTGRPIYAAVAEDGLYWVFVNGSLTAGLQGEETSCVYCLGTPQEGEIWTVEAQHAAGWTGQLWEYHGEALHAAVEGMNPAEVMSVDGRGRVRLAVQSTEARTLLTTIPAEDGWAAYVDGERVETADWLNAFLTLELPAGAHQVELRYTAPGLTAGAVLGLTTGAALGVFFFFLVERKRSKKKDF